MVSEKPSTSIARLQFSSHLSNSSGINPNLASFVVSLEPRAVCAKYTYKRANTRNFPQSQLGIKLGVAFSEEA